VARLEDSGLLANAVAAATLVDTELSYEERRPPPELVGSAAVVWRTRVGPDGHRQRLLPDGCVEVVFARDRLPIVYGPRRSWYELQVPAGDHVGVRLLPGAAARLLGIDAAQLSDRCVQVDELGAWRCLPDAEPTIQLHDLLRLLRERGAAHAPDPCLSEALALLHSEPGIGVAATARRIGVSERHLRRRFTHAVGLSPAIYGRIARVNATLRAARKDTPHSWSRLATDLGYSDQAHLSREVRTLTGSPPTDVRRPSPARPGPG